MPAPAPGAGPSVEASGAIGVGMVSFADGDAMLSALSAESSGTLVAQFGTSPLPAEDQCRPDVQLRMARPPGAARGAGAARWPRPLSVLEPRLPPAPLPPPAATVGIGRAAGREVGPAEPALARVELGAGGDAEEAAWGGAAEDHAAAADAYARLWTRSQMEDAPLE